MAATKTFQYTVIGRDGRKRTSRVEAPSQRLVVQRLSESGLTPVSISEISTTGLNREIHLGSDRVKPKDLAVCLRQLATLVGAGLSIVTALDALAEQTASGPLRKVLQEIAADVRGGTSLASAMAAHPQVFNPIAIAMIRAGEAGGFLDEVLVAVAENAESEMKLKRTIKSAMAYPTVVVVMAVVIVIAMLLFIVPIFEDIFSSLGSDLPAPTKVLVAASSAMKIIGPILLIAVIVGALWWRKHKNDQSVRAFLDPLKLKAPIIGPLMTKVCLARLSRTMSTMSRVGVPLVQVLELAAQTAGNLVVEQAVTRVRDKVMRGEPLGRAMSAEPVFGKMMTQMVSAGEEAGALDQMLDKVATFYDSEVDAATSAMTSVIEPLLIAVVGVMVGGILICLYLPIFQISTAVQ